MNATSNQAEKSKPKYGYQWSYSMTNGYRSLWIDIYPLSPLNLERSLAEAARRDGGEWAVKRAIKRIKSADGRAVYLIDRSLSVTYQADPTTDHWYGASMNLDTSGDREIKTLRRKILAMFEAESNGWLSPASLLAKLGALPIEMLHVTDGDCYDNETRVISSKLPTDFENPYPAKVGAA